MTLDPSWINLGPFEGRGPWRLNCYCGPGRTLKVNRDGDKLLAYCFREKQRRQKKKRSATFSVTRKMTRIRCCGRDSRPWRQSGMRCGSWFRPSWTTGASASYRRSAPTPRTDCSIGTNEPALPSPPSTTP